MRHHHLLHLVRCACAALALLTSLPAAANFFGGPERAAARARLAELTDIQARHQEALLARPGVIGVGVGVDFEANELVLKIFVEHGAPLPTLPSQIEGARVVVEREDRPTPAGGGSACMPCHDNQLSLPVEGGNSGKTDATCSACTLGFKACDAQTSREVWVTNAHCATDATGSPGSAAIGAAGYHVSPLDAPTCSTVTSAVGTVAAHAAPTCGGVTTVDATSFYSDPSLTQVSIRDIGVPSMIAASALPGDEVQKSGRTTGLTFGIVDAVNVTVNLTYNGCASATTLNQQIRVLDTTGDIFCWGGDSGSGLLNTNNTPDIVGLVFARNSDGTTCWANDIGNVLGSLGLTLDRWQCLEDYCPAEDAAQETSDPTGMREWLYRLRDEVLGKDEYGKRLIRTFYDVADAWVALYAQRPLLLSDTATALEQNLDVLSAIVEGEPVAVPASRIDALDALLRRHILATDDVALREAFEGWRRDIHDPALQAKYGVTVY